MIKEGRTILVYNVLPKKSGDLASNARTRFHCLDEDNSKRFEEINRRVLPISSISHTTGKALSNEFDTIGTIVRLKVNDNEQEMWLTDQNLKLLFIKVMEGPKLCCLFDGLNVGQNIAIWNLVTFGLQDKVAQAIANQYTLVSGHPQAPYLREALKKYSEEVTNVNDLVKEADIKVEECIIRSEFFQNRNYTKPLYSSVSINVSEIFDESSEDNASIPAGLTKTDVAMSLINTDEFC
ncbi:uncharacterized protein LOC108736700 [Agrilus planipennis]|uniref:Uncharacterized protein LOC108736700 n=1 Tax=Agrilus planipennis TaxID=224129 RepID=A0A1W4WW43_AGRPL|nr:uncharacterized protein LOC108736700 [Agrilus planipennis]